MPVGLTVIQWIMDFAERIKQLQKISEKVQESGIVVLKVSVSVNAIYGIPELVICCIDFPCMAGRAILSRGLHHSYKAVCGSS